MEVRDAKLGLYSRGAQRDKTCNEEAAVAGKDQGGGSECVFSLRCQ
jgi:hypothetical protein